MKTLFPYMNLELEELFEDLKNKERLHTELTGRQHGLNNQPVSETDMKIRITNPIATSIQELLDKNFQIHKPITAKATGVAVYSDAQERLTNLKIRSQNIEQQKRLAELDLQKLKRGVRSGIFRNVRIIVSVIFGFIEALLSFTLFRTASIQNEFAIVMSVGFGFAGAWGTFLGANWISKAPNPTIRKTRYKIIVAIGAIASLGLGLYRFGIYQNVLDMNSQIALEQSHASTSGFLSAIPNAVTSLLMFLIALSFELFYWQTLDEQKKELAYKAKRQECEQLKEEQEKIEQDIETINTTVTNTSSRLIEEQEYAKGYENRLCNLAHELLYTYQSNNIAYRTDKSCPTFFGSQYQWNFRLYFDSLFSSSKKIPS